MTNSVQTAELRRRVEVAYDEVTRLSTARIPYVYGGGHNAQFDLGHGGDCSSFVSRALHVAGLLGIPHVSFPMDTWHLENWGVPGAGKWMTVAVRDVPSQDHTFMLFHLGSKRPLIGAQAPHTGLEIGWYDTEVGAPAHGPAWGNLSTAGFNLRHWPGT